MIYGIMAASDLKVPGNCLHTHKFMPSVFGLNVIHCDLKFLFIFVFVLNLTLDLLSCVAVLEI